MNRVIGWCEECMGPVCQADEIPGHPSVYECPGCGHPCGLDDLFGVEAEKQGEDVKTYTIPTVKWVSVNPREGTFPEQWDADTIFGTMSVFKHHWYEHDDALAKRCDSIADGKAKAEAYYHSRLLPALEEVPTGSQVVGVHYEPESDHDRPPGCERP